MKVRIDPYPEDDFSDREISVEIENFDVWCLDSTLAYIIHPSLVKLKNIQHGAPDTDDEDVPEKLKSTSAPSKENEWDTDENHFKRWDYILDEMIWAFGQKMIDWEAQFFLGKVRIDMKEDGLVGFVSDDDYKFDKVSYEQHHSRMRNGFRLFGKYYERLWD